MTDEPSGEPKTPAPAEEPTDQKKTEPKDADRGQAIERLVEKLETLPQPTREVVEKLFVGLFRESGFSPKLDPEVVRILSASIDKDNENKFQYLTQKQHDATDIKRREQDQEAVRHGHRIKLLWPILTAAIVGGLGMTGTGVWFIATGKEAIGGGIIASVLSAAFAYLGGLGTARFFKSN